MTHDTASVSQKPQTESERPRTWGDIAAAFAWQMCRPDFERGDLAELRRMHPDSPSTAVYWRMMAQQDLLGRGADLENKWALILHGIALMTPTGEGGRSAHDGAIPVGRALYLGGDDERSSPYFSETRLNRLLTGRGPMLRVLLARMFRMMATADALFNWREMATFILNDGYSEERAELSRRRIAREYYSAERRSSRNAS